MAEAFDLWQERGLVLPAMESYVDSELTSFRVKLFVLQLPYEELVDQVDRARGLAEGMAGPGVRATVTGDLATNVHMVRQAVLGQASSLMILAVTVVLLLALAGSSLVWGFLLSMPMALSILSSYGLLVTAGLPYGIAVSMFPTLVVGLSVDFAIHLRASWQAGPGGHRTGRARRVGGHGPRHLGSTARSGAWASPCSRSRACLPIAIWGSCARW